MAANVPANASVDLFSSTDNGTTFETHFVANYTNASTSALFNSIGGPIGATSLATPGGIPGQVTAAANEESLFLLYTTSVGGRVVGESMISNDSGVNWTGPYFSASQFGSLQDPLAVSSPAGYTYVTWRENGAGGWQIDQSVYGADGREIEAPAPLPSLPGTFAKGAPGLALDDLMRPLYVWAANNSTGSEGLFTGAFLTAQNVTAVWEEGVGNLTSTDMVGNQTNLTSGLLSKLQALSNMEGAGANTGAIEKIEQDLYPKMTGLNLTLLCEGGNPVCGHVHRGSNPRWVVNNTGVTAPATFLAVYADWALESLGVGVLTPLPDDASVSYDGATLTATTTVLNPTVAQFSTSYVFPTYSTLISEEFSCTVLEGTTLHQEHVYLQSGDSAAVTATKASVSIDSQTFQSLKMGLSSTTFYATNLSASTQYGWSMELIGTYTQDHYTIISDPNAPCGLSDKITEVSPPTLSPPSISLDLAGSFSTEMSYVPAAPVFANPAPGVLHISFGTTIVPDPLTSTVCLQTDGSGCIVAQGYPSLLGDLCFGDCYYTGLSDGTYNVQGSVSTFPGTPTLPFTTDQYYVPALSLGVSYGSNPPILSSSFSCTLDLEPNPIHLSGLQITDIGSSKATVTWDSSGATSASLRYTPLGGSSLTWTPSIIKDLSGGAVEYGATLDALSSPAVYEVVVSESVAGSGCLNYLSTLTGQFATQGTVLLHEQDLPYDSITQEGGGAQVYFTLPSYFQTHAQLTSGSLTVALSDGSQPITLPATAFTLQNGEYTATVSTLSPNTPYVLSAALTFTLDGVSVPVAGIPAPPSPFIYLKDTSGDGLSDAEKVNGWDVTVTPLGGPTLTYGPVQAMPSDFATNGLTSDFVEKEFGLDPSTIDTIHSHMLDTWNMTFDLGPASANGGQGPALPSSGFRFWYENSTFSPFSACAAPRVCGYAPPLLSGELSNISHSDGADDSPWAAEQLWTGSGTGNALQSLETLISTEYQGGSFDTIPIGWLRAVTGTYDGERTMTVWGKLSWGADPLTASTPGDGIPDGARLNPLHEVALQITGVNGLLLSYSSIPKSCSIPVGLSSGDGFAFRFYLNQTSPGGPNEFQGFTTTGFVGCPPPTDPSTGQPLPAAVSAGADSTWTFPVNNEIQSQSLTLQMLVNTSTCASTNTCQKGVEGPFDQLPIAPGCSMTYQLPVDLLAPPPVSKIFVTQGSQNCAHAIQDAGLFSFSVNVAPYGTKAPTYLWLPNDNSTLSTNLPPGLQRYVGEQDFDLIVANISGSSLSSSGIPFPWGGTYASPITAPNGPQGQLVNFLVPRSQFFNSVLGQAILNNSPLPTKSNSPAASANDQISGLTLAQLACYWQNLAVAQSGTTFPDGTTSNGPTLCSGVSSSGSFKPGNGISPGTTFSATVHADTSCSSSPINCQWGGVPSQPNLENGLAAPALQAVITLNLTSDSNLTYLLAALLDNNTTASNGELGVNGYFEDVTNELPSLGLNTVVTGALANEVLSSGGFFGYPTSFAQPPPPPPPPQPTCSGFGCLWNTVSGAFVALGETIAAGIVGIAGAVWSGIQAATTFFEEVGQGLVQLAETARDAAISALAQVASAVLKALQALLAFTKDAITQFLTAVIQPVLNGLYATLAAESDSLASAASGVKDFATQDPIDLPTVATLSWDWMALVWGISFAIKVATIVAEEIVQDSPFGVAAGAVTSLVLPIVFGALSLKGSELFSPTALPQPIGNIISGALSLTSGVAIAAAEGLFNFSASIAGFANLKAGVFDPLVGGPDLFGVAALGALATGVMSGMVASIALEELDSFESADLTLAGAGEALIVDLLEYKDFLNVGDCTTASEQGAALAIVTAGSAGFVFDVLGVIAALEDLIHGMKQYLVDGSSLIVGILAMDLDLNQLASVSNACQLS